ncbi:MAG: hypothetical protein R2695_05885 [Acidimicrobiales bacterium]
MVLHLGRHLDLALRDQNVLLAAAGYAPEYRERGLDDPELDDVRGVLETVLAAYGPIPAYIVDRGWDLVLANDATMAMVVATGLDLAPDVMANVMRLALHPDGIRSRVRDWERFAAVLLHRLEREAVDRPFDDRIAATLDEARSYPGVAAIRSDSRLPTGDELVIPMVLETDLGTLRFVTMVATIGASFDVTLEELRLETLLPADRDTEDVLRRLAG